MKGDTSSNCVGTMSVNLMGHRKPGHVVTFAGPTIVFSLSISAHPRLSSLRSFQSSVAHFQEVSLGELESLLMVSLQGKSSGYVPEALLVPSGAVLQLSTS